MTQSSRGQKDKKWMTERNSSIRIGPSYQAVIPDLVQKPAAISLSQHDIQNEEECAINHNTTQSFSSSATVGTVYTYPEVKRMKPQSDSNETLGSQSV